MHTAMHSLIALACALVLLPCVGALRGLSFRQKLRPLERDRPLQPLTLAETAFLSLITVETPDENEPAETVRRAVDVFRRHGVVRIAGALSCEEADALVRQATQLQTRQRKAYGQASQADRYTLWLADSETSVVPRESESVLQRALYGDLSTVWQTCAAALGSPHVGLAEVVTSLPGGAAQAWHQDGAGLTHQIALCPIGLEQGPTEIRPRPFSAEYLVAMTQRAEYEVFADAAAVVHKLQRPLYELTSALHTTIWDALDSRISHEQAALGLRLRLLPPPPILRLTADTGMLIMYDAAMQHRGGANRGDYPRPILAVHMRDADAFGASRQIEQYT